MTPEQFNALPTPRTDAVNGLTRWEEYLKLRRMSHQLEREAALLEQALRLIWRDEGTTEAGCLAEETLRTLAEVRNTK
jgi:hypothetical protein